MEADYETAAALQAELEQLTATVVAAGASGTGHEQQRQRS